MRQLFCLFRITFAGPDPATNFSKLYCSKIASSVRVNRHAQMTLMETKQINKKISLRFVHLWLTSSATFLLVRYFIFDDLVKSICFLFYPVSFGIEIGCFSLLIPSALHFLVLLFLFSLFFLLLLNFLFPHFVVATSLLSFLPSGSYLSFSCLTSSLIDLLLCLLLFFWRSLCFRWSFFFLQCFQSVCYFPSTSL